MRIITTLFILAICALCTSVITAQTCLIDGIQFSTQEEVDSFPAYYPGCTTILGDVTISNSTVTNLDSLSVLLAIDGSLILSTNLSLSNLSGLSSITGIGKNLTIQSNDSLTNLTGFMALATIGEDVLIEGNNGLSQLTGLDSLKNIGGDLIIRDNDSLTSLTGLESLVIVGGILGIQADSSLNSLTGLTSLSSIGGSLTIDDNPALTSLSSLPSLFAIGENLYVSNNEVLSSLSGLDSLIIVKGNLTIANNDSLLTMSGLNALSSLEGDLEIYANISLISLSGLDSLATIGDYLRIYENPALTGLAGIQNINLTNLTELFLYFNEVLTYCSTPNICNYLEDPMHPAYIADNDPGCNDRPEVEAACVIPCNLVLEVKASPESICIGSSSTLSANVTGGQPPYTFEWSNGISSPIFLVTPLVSTTYSVTVTDSQGCTAEGAITINVTPLPIATASNNSPLCQGATLLLSASGGTLYSWTGPNNFSSFSPNPSILNVQTVHAGLYSVVVTDSYGCSAIATTHVIVNLPPVVSASSNSPVCQDGTIQLNALGGVSYKWSGPQSFSSTLQNPTIPNVKLVNGGKYNVTVTDITGCTAVTFTTVTILSNPTAFATNDSPMCQGQTITLNASGGIFYSWSGPNGFSSSEKSPQIQNVQPNQAGTYSVTVTGANGCTATKTTFVVVQNGPNAFADNTGPACVGQNVDLYASGGVEYFWSGPNGFYTNDQNPTLFDLQPADAGTYTVTITNINGCLGTASTDLIINAVFASTSVTHETCSGCNNGTASVSPSGASSYTYLWSNGKTTSVITGLSPGVYTVTVTGNNGCTITALAAVNAFNCPTIIITPTITHAACYGLNGMASVAVSGGNPPLTYLWNNNSNSNSITAPAGVYSVVVTDANNCAESIQVTITQPPLLIASATAFAVTCEGLCNGVASASASGGTTPYTWLWNTGSNLQSIFNLCPGQYAVTVIDSKGCIDDQTGITIGPGISVKPVIGGDTFICGDETGTLFVQPGFSSYIWNTGSFSSSINWSASGTYSVTVTQSFCSGTASVNTTANPDILVNLSFLNDTLFAQVSGGTPPYSYLWSTGATGSFLIPSASGTYSVIVFDQQDCTMEESLDVTISSISSHAALPLQFYPNPVHDQLNLILPGISEYQLLEIYTITGQRIWRKELTSEQEVIDVTHLLPGIYYLVLNQAGKLYRSGFVKQ